ncbi:hypothetical protein MJ904_19225 [Massilia sp. MB5]|uniref:hypothetical protein n=1 Tax=Massilia sp. MB5 TaxID=2919578 RepID=UPI001F0D57EB|nr:hypothetical protein [Massilia sp. MB5]UMR29207.1 hypothetical protein MJ904_19225 [Massilia sp. MB5]
MQKLKDQTETMLSSPASVPEREHRNEIDRLLEEAGDIVFRTTLLGQILFASQRSVNLLAAPRELKARCWPAWWPTATSRC